MLSDRDYTKARFRQAPSRGGDTVIKPLIVVNAAVYLLQMLSQHRLTSFISLDYGSVMQGEVWRLGTYMFAHGSFFHILFNMWGLYLFGGLVEQHIGGRKLLNLFLFGGFIGGVTWLMFNRSPLGETLIFEQGRPILHPVYPSSVGASGSVFGMLISAALLEPNRLILLLFPPIPLKLKTFALIYGVIEAFNTVNRGSQSNIAHLAHLGGMVGGYLYMRWIFRGRWANLSRSGPGLWHWPQKRKPKWDLFSSKPRSGPPPPPPKTFPGTGDPMQEIDPILDKIGKHGLSSLTEHERQVLQEVRERLKKKH